MIEKAAERSDLKLPRPDAAPTMVTPAREDPERRLG
jgi:hypothetical protein